ncbi:DUF3502 domain-containing protein [Paenibacillus sp. LMG 31461]|uniref:DUF3502 domain-containing protein n=1 Tax=Paenibacillus plantarum TaxID=2654975 RepID=A0ABX1X2X3_9BACL|nr:ABC transporter substrate-binding protein [Paenibacillus plantarum]NOU62601.1 DUF3502 domain-containing protein [Paenibacillus plantarum]
MDMFRKKRSKLSAISLCAGLMLALTVAGCETSGNNGKSSTSNTTVPTASTLADNKAVKLKWVFMGPGKQEDSERVWAEFNKRLQPLLPNTTVEFVELSRTEFVEKWKLLAASGEEIDLAWTGYLIPFVPEVKKGAFLPLDDLIAKYAPKLATGVPDWVMKRTVVDGKTYAVPNQQLEAGMGPSLKVPKDLADKYLDVKKLQAVNFGAKTSVKEAYEPIEAYLKALKDNNLLGKGASISTIMQFIQTKGYETFSSTNYIAGYRIDDKSFKVVNMYETPEFKDSFDVAADWFKKGYIRKDILSMQDPRVDDGKLNGSVVWAHNQVEEGTTVTPGNAQAGTVEYYNIPLSNQTFISSGDAATATVIPRTSKNPERAMQLIELINTSKGKELYDLLVWGLEGEHYKKVSPTRMETIGYTGQGTPTAKYGLWKWVLGNTFQTYETQADKEGYNTFVKKLHETATKSALMSFKPDTTAIATELAQVAAVRTEFENALRSGALADYEDKYKQAIDKMKKSGSDKIVAEMQRQVDEFVKKNNIK